MQLWYDFYTHFYRSLPACVTEWTHDHVRLFLVQRKLDETILSLCQRMDGHRLLNLYEMCLMNRESMYQSLKYELNSRHQILLPVGDYLTFLHEIRQYVPLTSSNVAKTQPSPSPSTFCNLL